MTIAPAPNGTPKGTHAADLASLEQKIDLLTSQVFYLNEQLQTQTRQLRAFEEFKQDVLPIANHMFRLTIDELAEIGSDFEGEDLLFLVKRLLRDTHLLLKLLDQIEGFMGLMDEAGLMGKQVFNQTVETLDQLERKGYFTFVRGLGYITERVVTEFNEDDVHALGDNIVTILTTVRNMTQPDILAMANKAIDTIHEEPDSTGLSAWALIREMNDPKVRKGLSRMLNMLKAMAEQPSTN